jgi:outer membrane receptor protein involved in Fe transport
VRADADGWGSLRLSAYRTESRQFITLKYLLLVFGRPRFEYENIGRVQVDGLELSGHARIRAVQTQLAVTLPRGRDLATGHRLSDIGTARVTADVAFPVGRWLPSGLLSLRARWNDAVIAEFSDAASLALARHAFWTVNAELGTTLAGTRVAVAVKNLFDTQYREPLSFIDEPGRAFSFALKREFQVPLATAKESR